MFTRTIDLQQNFLALARFCPVLLLAACQINPQANSPDVKYSNKSSAAVRLQVPPDLTDVTRGEQFVLPGDTGGSLARNTLLPEFESVKYQRNSTQGWLVTAASPEQMWPRLQDFLRNEGYEVSRTQPLNGVIETQWRKKNSDSGTLRNLIASSGAVAQRVAFRLERSEQKGTRIFARTQLAGEEESFDDARLWSRESGSTQANGLLLQRLLVFLGIEEQRAKGLIDSAQTTSLTLPVTVQSTTSGTSLVLHYGYQPSLTATAYAVSKLGMEVVSKDESSGILRLRDTNNIAGNGDGATELTLQLNPQHISSVVLSVANKQGTRLDAAVEKKVLFAIRDQLT